MGEGAVVPDRPAHRTTSASVRWVWRVIAAAALALALTSFEPVAPVEDSFPDAVEYMELAHNVVTGDGYRTDTRPSPRYPPGLPILLAPFAALGDAADDLRLFPPVAGTALVLLMGWAAKELGGEPATAFTWLLAAFSQGIGGSTTQVLSDLPAAALVCAALVSVLRGRQLVAGVLIGLSATVRLGHAALGLAASRPRGWIGVLLVLVPLAFIQLLLFGSLSGYDDGTADFGVQWLWERPIRGAGKVAAQPNPEFYLQQLAGRGWWLVPGTAVLSLIELWLRRHERVARFTATVIVVNLATYFLYFYQDSRFVLTSAVLVVVFAGAAIGRLLGRVGIAEINQRPMDGVQALAGQSNDPEGREL